MALPIAPLGQMATINLPNYIPNTVVPDRNPLNLALAAFLSGAAGNAGQALVSNATSRDFAGQFGEQEATGMDRVLRGPKVNAQQAGQRRSESAINARLDKEIGAVDARLTKQLGEQGRQFDISTGQTNRRLDQTDSQLGETRRQFDTSTSQTNRRLDQTDAQFGETKRQFDTSSAQTNRRLDQGDTENALRTKEVNARLEQLVKEGELTRARAEQIAVEMSKTKEETRMIKGQNDFLDERRKGPPPKKNPLEGAKMPGGQTSSAVPTGGMPPEVDFQQNLDAITQQLLAAASSTPPPQEPTWGQLQQQKNQPSSGATLPDFNQPAAPMAPGPEEPMILGGVPVDPALARILRMIAGPTTEQQRQQYPGLFK